MPGPRPLFQSLPRDAAAGLPTFDEIERDFGGAPVPGAIEAPSPLLSAFLTDQEDAKEEDSAWWVRALEFIEGITFGQSVKGLLAGTGEEGIEDNLSEFVRKNPLFQITDAIGLTDLTGDRVEFTDVRTNLFGQDPAEVNEGWGNFAFNLVGSILTDPGSFLMPLGLTKSGVTAASKATQIGATAGKAASQGALATTSLVKSVENGYRTAAVFKLWGVPGRLIIPTPKSMNLALAHSLEGIGNLLHTNGVTGPILNRFSVGAVRLGTDRALLGTERAAGAFSASDIFHGRDLAVTGSEARKAMRLTLKAGNEKMREVFADIMPALMQVARQSPEILTDPSVGRTLTRLIESGVGRGSLIDDFGEPLAGTALIEEQAQIVDWVTTDFFNRRALTRARKAADDRKIGEVYEAAARGDNKAMDIIMDEHADLALPTKTMETQGRALRPGVDIQDFDVVKRDRNIEGLLEDPTAATATGIKGRSSVEQALSPSTREAGAEAVALDAAADFKEIMDGAKDKGDLLERLLGASDDVRGILDKIGDAENHAGLLNDIMAGYFPRNMTEGMTHLLNTRFKAFVGQRGKAAIDATASFMKHRQFTELSVFDVNWIGRELGLKFMGRTPLKAFDKSARTGAMQVAADILNPPFIRGFKEKFWKSKGAEGKAYEEALQVFETNPMLATYQRMQDSMRAMSTHKVTSELLSPDSVFIDLTEKFGNGAKIAEIVESGKYVGMMAGKAGRFGLKTPGSVFRAVMRNEDNSAAFIARNRMSAEVRDNLGKDITHYDRMVDLLQNASEIPNFDSGVGAGTKSLLVPSTHDPSGVRSLKENIAALRDVSEKLDRAKRSGGGVVPRDVGRGVPLGEKMKSNEAFRALSPRNITKGPGGEFGFKSKDLSSIKAAYGEAREDSFWRRIGDLEAAESKEEIAEILSGIREDLLEIRSDRFADMGADEFFKTRALLKERPKGFSDLDDLLNREVDLEEALRGMTEGGQPQLQIDLVVEELRANRASQLKIMGEGDIATNLPEAFGAGEIGKLKAQKQYLMSHVIQPLRAAARDEANSLKAMRDALVEATERKAGVRKLFDVERGELKEAQDLFDQLGADITGGSGPGGSLRSKFDITVDVDADGIPQMIVSDDNGFAGISSAIGRSSEASMADQLRSLNAEIRAQAKAGDAAGAFKLARKEAARFKDEMVHRARDLQSNLGAKIDRLERAAKKGGGAQGNRAIFGKRERLVSKFTEGQRAELMRTVKESTNSSAMDQRLKITMAQKEQGYSTLDELEQLSPKMKAKLDKETIHFMRRETYDAIWGADGKGGAMAMIKSPDKMGHLLRGFDKWQRWWKGWTVVPWSQSRVRDMASNYMLLQQGGISNLKMLSAMKDSWRITKAYRGLIAGDPDASAKMASQFINLGGGRKISMAQVLRDVQTRIGMGSSYVMDEMQFAAGQAMELLSKKQGALAGPSGVVKRLFNPKNLLPEGQASHPIFRMGYTVTEYGDSMPKIMGYIAELKSGKSAAEAAANVRAWTYSPDNMLTAFERHSVARLIPFYRWAKFAVTAEVGAAMARPGTVSVWQKIYENAHKGVGVDSADLDVVRPEWISDRLGIPIKKTKKGFDFFVGGSFVAMGEVVELANTIGKVLDPEDKNSLWNYVGGKMTPIIQKGIETIRNESTFTERAIEQTPGETTDIFFGIPMRKKAANWLRMFRVVTEVAKLKIFTPQEMDELVKISSGNRVDRPLGQRILESAFSPVPKLSDIDVEQQARFKGFELSKKGAKRKALLRKGQRENVSEDEMEELVHQVAIIENEKKKLLRVRDAARRP